MLSKHQCTLFALFRTLLIEHTRETKCSKVEQSRMGLEITFYLAWTYVDLVPLSEVH